VASGNRSISLLEIGGVGVRGGESIFLFELLDCHRLRFTNVLAPQAVLPGTFGGELQVRPNLVLSRGRHVALLSDRSVQVGVNFGLVHLRIQRFVVSLSGFLLRIVTLNSEVAASLRLHLEFYHRPRAHKVLFVVLGHRARYLVRLLDTLEL
jgi:hypothetical protein